MTAADDGGILAAFVAKAAADPALVFARFDGAPVTFGALDARSGALATALRRQGHAPGTHVAVMLRNSVDALAVILGLAKAGLVWVPVNVGQRGAGLAYLLDHAGPAVAIVEHDLAPEIAGCGAALAATEIVLRDPDAPETGLAALLATEPGDDAPLPSPTDTFAIMYTSGTTGPPKGVVVTHRMMRRAADGVLEVTAARAGDVFFVWEPLYHIGGAQLVALPALAGVELAMTARFSASRFWRQVALSGATHIHYLGGILQILLKQPRTLEETDNRVRVAWGGGCPAEVFAALKARFGFEVRECYGMTEMSSITTASDGRQGGVVGRALPWFTVTIRDEDGAVLPAGARGEIVVETSDSGAFTPGYHRAPEATAKALEGGRMHTGDIGSLDADGTLAFHGRRTDSMRVRGENVSAWEVEHVVNTHPDIEDCAALGVPAEIGEEDILLYVQATAGATLTTAGLSAWLGPRLAPYQTPRYLVFVDGFERTPSQRIMKHRLPRETAGTWDRLA